MIITASVFWFSGTALASTTDGTVSGYAWGNRIGWINFGCANCNAHITDSGMSGYAWSQNFGWITLNATQSGVDNNSEGTLSAKAWGEQIGWINFSGVTVSSAGAFSGTATVDEGGSIAFGCTNCNVTTDWRPASTRDGGGGGSGSGTGGSTNNNPIAGPFSISINDGNQYTNNRSVVLLIDGSMSAVSMELSNTADFLTAVKENYTTSKNWVLPVGDGTKTVYVRFYGSNGLASNPVADSIVLDTTAPDILITSLKNSYTENEEVTVVGTTEADVQVMMITDNRYGVFTADHAGNFNITLGKKSAGAHHLEFTAQDTAGNIGKTVTADFLVEKTAVAPTPIIPFFPNILAPPLAPLLHQLQEGITSLIPKIFLPLEKPGPTPVVTVPLQAPLAFKTPFRYISTQTLAKFVLTPLPQDIKLLAQKLPQIQKTFNQVGIQKLNDLEKLKNTNLKLPTLTETALPETTVATGKFDTIKGIPVARLSDVAKARIPSAVVFAKGAGGLVDFNVALSINDKGKTEQKIETIAGQPLQLVVRADKPVKSIKGYIIFKSRKSTAPVTAVPLNNLTASLLFTNPNMAQDVLAHSQVPVEGSKVAFDTLAMADTKKDIERRLVLSTFEYVDNGNGLYTATVDTPVVDGEYEIITVMDYEGEVVEQKEIRLLTVVDPEGYVYEKNGDKETRIAGAIVSLYWLNSDTKQYELWPARDYQQENSQTTDVRGTYSFLVPNGYFYLKVDAPGYVSYDGKPFEVKEGSGVHINIEMKTKYWWLSLLDWKTVLLVVIVIMLLYNFYRDRMREKNVPVSQKKSNHGI